MEMTPTTGETFDWFVKQVQANAKQVQANAKAKADKKTEAKYKQIGDAAQAVNDFAALLQGKPLSPDDKKKALKGALKTLVKALCGPHTEDSEIPNEITAAIDALTDPDPTHKKQWDDALKALKHWLARVIVKNKSISSLLSGGGKTTDALKGLDDLIAKTDTLVKVLCGNATDAERDQILKDSLMDLLTSTVIVEQLKWFVTENALTYVQAVKIGYQLGEPIGKQLAQDLTKIIGAQLGKNTILALESKWTTATGQPGDGSWVNAAAAGERPTAKLTGAFSGWTVQAYFDAAANDVRILCQNGEQAIVLDGNGNIAVDTGPLPQAQATSGFTNDGAESGYRPWLAFNNAIGKTKGLKEDMDAAQTAASPTLKAWTALQSEQQDLQTAIAEINAKISDHKAHVWYAGDKVLTALQADLKAKLDRLAQVRLELPAAAAAYKAMHGIYWLKYLAYTNAVRQWLIKAAIFEKWTDAEIAYAARQWPAFAFSRSDLVSPTGGYGFGTGGKAYAPVALTNVLVNYLRQSRAAQAVLIVSTLVGAALGLQLSGAGGSVPTEATAAPAQTAASTAGRTAPSVPFDPCSMLTTAEAAAILEKPVTATSSGTRCTYKPQTPAVFAVPTDGGTATIRIDSVVLTGVTGSDASVRYASFEALFGRDPWDQQVAGIGDKAIYTRGSDLSVLQGASFVGVSSSGETSLPSSSTNQFTSVRQRYIGILEAFARPALQRLPSATATSAPARTQAAPTPSRAPSPSPTRTASPSPSPSPSPTGSATPRPTPTGSDVPTPRPSSSPSLAPIGALETLALPIISPTPTPTPSPTTANGPNTAGAILGGMAGLVLSTLALAFVAARRS